MVSGLVGYGLQSAESKGPPWVMVVVLSPPDPRWALLSMDNKTVDSHCCPSKGL